MTVITRINDVSAKQIAPAPTRSPYYYLISLNASNFPIVFVSKVSIADPIWLEVITVVVVEVGDLVFILIIILLMGFLHLATVVIKDAVIIIWHAHHCQWYARIVRFDDFPVLLKRDLCTVEFIS